MCLSQTALAVYQSVCAKDIAKSFEIVKFTKQKKSKYF